MHVALAGVRLRQQQLRGRAAEQLAGLVNGAERHGGRTGELDVVVSDDRQLTGYLDPSLGGALEETEGDEVVGAEGRRGAAPRREPEELLAGLATVGDRELGGLDHRECVDIPAGG